MIIHSLTANKLAGVWLLGLAVTAIVVTVGRLPSRRAFDEVIREVDAVGVRLSGTASEVPVSTSESSPQSLGTIVLPADSAAARRVDLVTRHYTVTRGLALAAALAVPLFLVALTAYWIWLRRSG